MTEPANAPSVPDTGGREYLELWAQSLSEVLGQVAGSAFGVECPQAAPADAPAAAESDLHFCVAASGGLRGEMDLRAPASVVVAFARALMAEPPDPTAAFKPEDREAAEELLRQVAGHFASALKPRWGEVQLRVESGPAPSWPAGATGWLCSAAGTSFSFALESQLSAALLAALRTPAQPAAQPAEAAPAPGVPTLVADKLDLLKDVELDVTLRFGGKRMLLRHILELNSGSVVELDRELQEPADLLVDGKLIARGEVVVVDGNYGLRVTEIMSGQLPG